MKKIIALLLALAMVASLAACSTTQKPDNKPTNPTNPTLQTQAPTEPKPTTQPTEPAAYPVTLTDHAGRTVTIEKQPERIVSGYYISTSAVIALGLKDKLVGIEAKANKRPIYKLSAPELIDLPNVGTAKEFDLEGCLALTPDLVILPLKLKNVVENLEKMGITVILVNPESQELLLSMVDLIAKAANASEQEQALRSFIQTQEGKLSAITGNKPTVYLAGNSSLLSTAGGKMYQSDMIKQAGGVNVAENLTDSNWAEISYEQLLTWDPEYIVLASDASYTVEDVLSDPNLSSCKAVQNGHVVHLPSDVESWDSPIPSGILGSLWIASVLHADQITEEQVNETITEFYAQFYGFTYGQN